MTLEQLRDFNRFSRLLTGRGSGRGKEIFGCYAFGISYCAQRVPEAVRFSLRLDFSRQVYEAMASGDDVPLVELGRATLDRLHESVLNNYEVHGKGKHRRAQAKDFLRTLTYVGHHIQPWID